MRNSSDFEDVTCECCSTPRPPESDERNVSADASLPQVECTNEHQYGWNVNRAARIAGAAGRAVLGAVTAPIRESVRAAVGGGALMLGDDHNPLVTAHYLHDYVNCKTLEKDLKLKLGIPASN